MNVTMVVLLSAVEVLLLVLIGLVAAAETAFTRVSRSRADAIAAAEDETDSDDAHHDRVEDLVDYSRRPLTTLASLALVLLAAQVGAGVCGWMIGHEVAGRAGAVVGVAVTALAIFAAIAVSRSRSLLAPDAAAVGLVPVLRLVAPLAGLTRWLVGLVRRSSSPAETDPDVDEQQLLALVEEAAAIAPDEEALIRRVVAFDDQTVGSIMTPRTDMVTLRSGFAVRDALEVAALHGLSRIPVTSIGSDVDDIIGAVHVKDLMVANLDDKGHVDIDLWLREVKIVPEVQRAAQLLNELKTSDMHLAIVVDEHGGVAGVVTLEDIIEELVGEIEDEFDTPEPDIRVVGPSTIRVDGRCEIPRVNEALGVELSGDFRTIAGCVFNKLGRVPEVGDVVSLETPEVELEVLRMHGRRIADVQVRSSVPIAVTAEEPA